MHIGIGDFQYVAAYTVQVLELLATFDQVIEWVWRQPWSWISCVFLFVRYGSLVTQAMVLHQQLHAVAHPYSHDQCTKWVVLRTFSPFVFVSCVHNILIARVYALCNRSGWLLFVLVLLLISGNICTAVFYMRVFTNPMEYNSRCEVLHVSKYPQTYFWTSVPPLTLDFIILILTFKRVLSLNCQPRLIPMLRTVIIDGMWSAFLLWSSVVVATAFAICGFLETGYVVASSWMITLLSFAATLTVLNVRRYNTPTSRYPNEADTNTEEHDIALTAYISVNGMAMLRSRNDDR